MYTITQKADAYIRGYEEGYFLGGRYLNAYNPYTTFWPGVILNALWRDGFVEGSKQKKGEETNANSKV